jgi:hypothetical protein
MRRYLLSVAVIPFIWVSALLYRSFVVIAFDINLTVEAILVASVVGKAEVVACLMEACRHPKELYAHAVVSART